MVNLYSKQTSKVISCQAKPNLLLFRLILTFQDKARIISLWANKLRTSIFSENPYSKHSEILTHLISFGSFNPRGRYVIFEFFSSQYVKIKGIFYNMTCLRI